MNDECSNYFTINEHCSSTVFISLSHAAILISFNLDETSKNILIIALVWYNVIVETWQNTQRKDCKITFVVIP